MEQYRATPINPKVTARMQTAIKTGSVSDVIDLVENHGGDIEGIVDLGLPPYLYAKHLRDEVISKSKMKKMDAVLAFLAKKATGKILEAVRAGGPPNRLSLLRALGADLAPSLLRIAVENAVAPAVIDFLISDDENMKLSLEDEAENYVQLCKDKGHVALEVHIAGILTERLWKVVDDGFPQERLVTLVKLGAHVNCLRNNVTPLIATIQQDDVLKGVDNTGMVETLLRMGAPVTQEAMDMAEYADPRNARICRLLEQALLNGELFKQTSIDDIHAILNKGADINSTDSHGNTLLGVLIVQGQLDMEGLEKIVKFGADIEHVNADGYKPLHLAVLHDDSCEIVARLLGMGAKLTADIMTIAQARSRTAASIVIKAHMDKLLFARLRSGDVQEVLQLGADPRISCGDEGEYQGWSPLAIVSHLGRKDVVISILEHAPDSINATSPSPIAVAVESGWLDIVELLHQQGASLIDMLHGVKDISVAKYLLRQGADAQHINEAGEMPYQTATDPVIKALLEDAAVAPPDMPPNRAYAEPVSDDIDLAPLIEEIKMKNFDEDDESALSRLLARSTIRRTNPHKALVKAVKSAKPSSVKAAMSNGGDARCKNNRGETMLELAKRLEKRLHDQSIGSSLSVREWRELMDRLNSMKEIVKMIQETLNLKVVDGAVSNKGFELRTANKAGGELTQDILKIICTKHDNPQLVRYCVDHHPQCAELLLSPGLADPQSMTGRYIVWQLSAWLGDAVASGNVERCQQLLKAGASCRFVRDGQESDLVKLSGDNAQLHTLLLEAGAAGTQGEKSWELAHRLRVSAANGDLDSVKDCHQKGGSIDAYNVYGSSALLLSVVHGEYLPVVHYLVTHMSSLRHSDPRYKTLIRQARLSGSDAVASYLQDIVNKQLIAAVDTCDIPLADELIGLGASVQDVELDSAVEHGIDILKFLVERGANLLGHNSNGRSALSLAVEKGDFAIVEYIDHLHPNSKTLPDEDGRTALDIAKEKNYTEIVRLLEPADAADMTATTTAAERATRHDLEDLIAAVRSANMDMIRDFVSEPYPSVQLKLTHVEAMLDAAKDCHQKEIEAMLNPVRASLLSAKMSDVRAEIVIDSRSAPSKGGSAPAEPGQRSMEGFFVGMTANITGSDLLDIRKNDPRAFDKLVSNLSGRIQDENNHFGEIKSKADLQAQYEKETSALAERVESLASEMKQMKSYEEQSRAKFMALEARLEEASTTAAERVETHNEMKQLRDEMATVQAQQSILMAEYQRNEDRKQVMDNLKESPSLLLFFRTLAIKIEEAFVGSKAGASGFTSVEVGATKSGLGAASASLNLLGDVVSLVPLAGTAVEKALIKTAAKGLRTLDRRRTRNVARNISMLATMAEVQKAADSVAGRLTLCYSHQINLLKPPADDDKGNDEMLSPRAFAEYCALLIVKSLRDGDFVPSRPLEDQLAWSVLHHDPYKKKSWKDKLGKGLGGTKLWFANGDKVEVRALLARCGIMTDDGVLYGNKSVDAERFGYCRGTKEMAAAHGFGEIGHGDAMSDEERKQFDAFGGEWRSGPKPLTVDEEVNNAIESAGVSKEAIRDMVHDETQTIQLELEEKHEELVSLVSERVSAIEDSVTAMTDRINEALLKLTQATDGIRADIVSQMSQQQETLKQTIEEDRASSNALISSSITEAVLQVRAEVDGKVSEMVEANSSAVNEAKTALNTASSRFDSMMADQTLSTKSVLEDATRRFDSVVADQDKATQALQASVTAQLSGVVAAAQQQASDTIKELVQEARETAKAHEGKLTGLHQRVEDQLKVMKDVHDEKMKQVRVEFAELFTTVHRQNDELDEKLKNSIEEATTRLQNASIGDVIGQFRSYKLEQKKETDRLHDNIANLMMRLDTISSSQLEMTRSFADLQERVSTGQTAQRMPRRQKAVVAVSEPLVMTYDAGDIQDDEIEAVF